jgi:diguanylate cyclase (GGDEF)-like protein/PAS domain S-box-containing protein
LSLIEIAWRRLLIATSIIFLLGFAILTASSINSHKSTKEESVRGNLQMLSDMVVASIRDIILSGSGQVVHDWVLDLKKTRGIDILQILRTDGMEAYFDGSTVVRVNEYLGEERFQAKAYSASGEKNINTLSSSFPVRLGHLETVRNSGKSHFFNETHNDARFVTLVTPIVLSDECLSCHGYYKGDVFGFVRISIDRKVIDESINKGVESELLRSIATALVVFLILGLYFSSLISKLKANEEKLRLSSTVFDNALECILITDSEGKVVSINPAFTRITGYSLEDIKGKDPSLLSSGRHSTAFYRAMWRGITTAGQWTGEIWNKKKNGIVHPVQLSITVIKNSHGEHVHYAGIFTDITERKKNEELIEYLAFHDNLTGLPNRQTFQDLILVELAHAKRYNYITAIMFLDLDRFKEVNDTHGHDVGDVVLKSVAKKLQDCIRKGDTISRLGGDEFTILLPQLSQVRDAEKVAKKIVEIFDEDLSINGHKLNIGVSIGISIYPNNGSDPAELLKRADDAMYKAKGSGKSDYILFDDIKKKV